MAWIAGFMVVHWDRQTQKVKKFPIVIDSDGIEQIAFSPDGKSLAVACRKSFRMIDLEAGTVGKPWIGVGGEVVRFTPDGTHIALGGELDEPIRLYHVAQRKRVRSFACDRQLDYTFEFSKDGKTLVNAGDGSLIFWDVATGVPHDMIPIGERQFVNGIAFSPDENTIALSADRSDLVLISRTTRQQLHPEHGLSLQAARFMPDGKSIAAVCSDGPRMGAAIFDQADGRRLRILPANLTGMTDRRLAPSPDGKWLAVGSTNEKFVRLIDVSTGEVVRTLNVERGRALPAFSPDSKTLVTLGRDSDLRFWNHQAGKIVLRIQDKSQTGWGDAALFTPDGKRLIASREGVIRIIDTDSGEILSSIEVVHETLAISADGQRLAIGPNYLDEPILIWDLKAGLAVHKVPVPENDSVSALALSPDGSRLAFTRFFDGDIHVVNVADQKTVATLRGHRGHIESLEYSRDGQRLLSASYDATAILWKAP